MKKTSDFYFYITSVDEGGIIVIFISIEFWDTDEGLDCKDEPEELYDLLDSIGGSESMENHFEFVDQKPDLLREKLLNMGFVENLDIANDPLLA